MVGIGEGRALFAGMGLDGDFFFRHVAVDSPVLEFFRCIDPPAALSWDAKAWMVEDEEELAVRFEMGGGIGEGFFGVGDVLQREEKDGAIEIAFLERE